MQARAAAMNGDHTRAALLLAGLAQSQPGQVEIAAKALSEAIGAGRMDLALQLVAGVPAAKLSSDGKLLMVTEELKRRRPDRALQWLAGSGGESVDLTFLSPLVTTWGAADRGDLNSALATLDALPANSALGTLRDEERALILLKFKRAADAEPFARRALGDAGNRETHLRLAFADGFLAAGDQARASAMVEGISPDAAAARQRILAGHQTGEAIDTPAKALSEVLTAFAADVARMQRASPPVGLVQVARYANPQNSEATLLLALLLDHTGRADEALGLLRAVPGDDPFVGDARDEQVRILSTHKRQPEAYALAQSAASAPDAGVSDYSRLGDVLEAMKRHDLAAAAYGRAVALAQAQGVAKADLWPLLLLEASALESAKNWPAARAALQQALVIAPDQPLLLNFLGYAQLERGENVDAAEAMIRKASELAPDDASITDSLGWAQFKRGKVTEAIATLQRAAEKDPAQADIQEHLGDALYAAGERLEARYAWSAALITAEDDVEARVKAKLSGGLNPGDAAP
jgi:tetratricopeptide (TPR) repeat protein